MSIVPSHTLHAHVQAFAAGAATDSSVPIVITAGGTGDETAITGQTIDTQAQRGDSMVFGVVAYASLANTKTLKVAAELQETDDPTGSWDTAEALYTATVLATGATPTTEYHAVKISHVDLRMRKRYIRFNCTPDLSNTGTDTATIAMFALMTGSKVYPVM